MVAGITVFASEWVGIESTIPHTRILNQCLDTRFPAVLCQRESVMSCVGAANFHDNCLVLPPVAAAAPSPSPSAARPFDRPAGRHHVEVELWKLQTNGKKAGRKDGSHGGWKGEGLCGTGSPMQFQRYQKIDCV